MCTFKTFAVGLGLLGMVLAFPVTSWAVAGGGVSCSSLGAGGKALTGVGVIHLSNSDGLNADVDALLRLKYKSTTKVFRVHVGGVNIESEGEVLCSILAAIPKDDMGLTILEAFSLQGQVLQLNDTSITGTDKQIVPGVVGVEMAISNLAIFVE